MRDISCILKTADLFLSWIDKQLSVHSYMGAPDGKITIHLTFMQTITILTWPVRKVIISSLAADGYHHIKICFNGRNDVLTMQSPLYD